MVRNSDGRFKNDFFKLRRPFLNRCGNPNSRLKKEFEIQTGRFKFDAEIPLVAWKKNSKSRLPFWKSIRNSNRRFEIDAEIQKRCWGNHAEIKTLRLKNLTEIQTSIWKMNSKFGRPFSNWIWNSDGRLENSKPKRPFWNRGGNPLGGLEKEFEIEIAVLKMVRNPNGRLEKEDTHFRNEFKIEIAVFKVKSKSMRGSKRSFKNECGIQRAVLKKISKSANGRFENEVEIQTTVLKPTRKPKRSFWK